MNSLRRNLTHSLLAAILILASVGLIAIFLAARYAVTDQFDVALRAKAQAIETLTQNAPGGATVGFTDRFFRGFDDRRPRDFFELWDASGRTLARSESLQDAHLQLRPGLGSIARFWAVDLPRGRRGRALGLTFIPRVAGARPTGPILQLIVVTDRDDLDDNLRILIALCTGCALALLGATLWIIPFVLRRGLVPLDQLGDQASAIDSHSLGRRFSVEDLPEELTPIAVRLNDLLARIEQSFERERRFSADLAHELRTPLAELRSSAECALKWPEAREASADRDTLAIALQMEGMVSYMLALARSEQGLLEIRREPVALAALARLRWERLKAAAAARGLLARLDLPAETAEATLLTDPTLLRAIVDNLLENAVAYAPAGGRIEIAVAGQSIRVSNTVADFDPADVARLFERFWRKESARSDGQHVGLGLALARAFAEALGGRLEATLVDPTTLAFTLSWPPRYS